MKVNLRFQYNLDLFLEIEAESEEAAKEQLRSMSCKDIINNCSVRNEEIKDIDAYTILSTNICL